MDTNIEEMKQRFLTLLRSIGREGVEKVIEKLEERHHEINFFDAPASTKFHLNRPGGLLRHSLNVAETALRLRDVMVEMDPSVADRLPRESVLIAGLLHDVCKATAYRIKEVFIKEVYVADNTIEPFGHGEKSVIQLLRWGMPLTDDEILAIRWHMHAWEIAMQSWDAKGKYEAARNQAPLVPLIIAADGLASGILER